MVAPSHSRPGSSGGAKVAHIVHHDGFYLIGGDITFLVENYLFRVHKYFFQRESPFFQAKLLMPASPGQTPVGTSDNNAFVLDNVKADDFARFLWVFYNPKYSLYEATVEDWEIILGLAHEWGFSEVKNLAVRELEKKTLEDIQKIVIYQRFDVDRIYLVPNFVALCSRAEPLSLQESKELGWDTAVPITHARELARKKVSGTISPAFAQLDKDDMVDVIREVFSIPEGAVSAEPAAPALSPPSVNGKAQNGRTSAAEPGHMNPFAFSGSARPPSPAANGRSTPDFMGSNFSSLANGSGFQPFASPSMTTQEPQSVANGESGSQPSASNPVVENPTAGGATSGNNAVDPEDPFTAGETPVIPETPVTAGGAGDDKDSGDAESVSGGKQSKKNKRKGKP